MSEQKTTQNETNFFSGNHKTQNRLLALILALLLASEATAIELKYDKSNLMDNFGGDNTLFLISSALLGTLLFLAAAIGEYYKEQLDKQYDPLEARASDPRSQPS